MRTISFLLNILSLGCLTAAICSCTGEAVDPAYTLNANLLKVQDVNMLGTTTDTLFTVVSNSAWSLSVTSGDEATLNLGSKSGTGTASVRITPGENPSAVAPRQWTLEVKTETGLSRSINITQSEAGAMLMVSPESINAPAEGETITVSITSNANWTAELTGQANSFVRFKDNVNSGSGNATIELIVLKNEDITSRNGSLKLSATDSRKQVQVKEVAIQQAAMEYTLGVTPSNMSLLASESEQTVTITSNSTWTATLSGDPFVTIGQDGLRSISGTGNQTLTLNVSENMAPNDRTAHLTVTLDKDNTKTADVEIKQQKRGITLRLYTSDVMLSNTASEFDISLRSDGTWDVTGAASWLRLDRHSGGVDDQTVHVSVDANPTSEMRRDTLTFNVYYGGAVVYSAQCRITQAGQGAPTLAAVTATSTGETSAHLSATYTSDAAHVGVVTECGFYYSTSADDVTSGTQVSCQVGNASSDTFTADLTGLMPNQTYYVVAYATNVRGRGLSQVVSVKTGGTNPNEDDINTPDTP